MNDRLNIKIGRIVVLYIIATYILYLILPIKDFHDSNLKEIYTVIFLTFVCVAFYFGCKSIPVLMQPVTKLPSLSVIKPSILCILILVVTADLWLYLYDLVNSGLAQFSFAMGDNYKSLLYNDQITQNSTWGRFFVLLSPLRVFLIAYCIYNYSNLTTILKYSLYTLLLSNIFLGVSRGQQVDLGNVLIYIFVPFFIKSLQVGKIKELLRKAAIGSLIFIAFFVFSQLVRATALDSDLAEQYDTNSLLFRIFGNQIGSGLSAFFMYFSHGYKGLNYCLQLPFEWTCGYGGSRALDQYLVQYLDFPSKFNDTYPLRVKAVFGYDCEMSWPTAFPWWASDFSFPGVVVLMYFLGRLFCKVFRDAYYNSNIFAIAFLCELVIMVLFLPLNNQAFQARDSLLITVVLFGMWTYNRKKKYNQI